MRVGLNLLYLIPGIVGGTETYAVSLIRAMTTEFPDDDFIVFLNQEASKLAFGEMKNLFPVVCPVYAESRFKRYWFEQTAFLKIVKRHSIEILHSLGYVGPFYATCPHVVTIHDVNYVRHGESMSVFRRKLLKYFVERTAQKCQHVITVSKASKIDILRYMKLPETKVSVVYEAASDDITPLSDQKCDDILRHYDIHRPYIAALSSTSRHKNIDRLIHAFASLSNEIDCNLVLIGYLPEGNEILRLVDTLQIGSRVHITGFVKHRELNALFQKARLFVFPSLYEGFGLPLLEAQKLGVPVVCSDRASLPEIANGTAMLFDPESEQEMRSSIMKCLQSDGLLQDLKDRGISNVSRFSWEKAAQDTMKIYRSLTQ
jgi:glycosyltransferase involved in cell wall biosynthesis